MPYLYFDWTFIILIPSMLLAMLAQYKLQSTFNKYSQVRARSGHTAAEVASALLRSANLDTSVERVGGNLTDHYSPRENKLRLSESVYNSSSIAALGVAAHEVGHALQDQEDYLPMRVQFFVNPIASVASMASMPLILIGLFFSYTFVHIGIIAFSIVVLYYLLMLPVEFNASSRAVAALSATGYLEQGELEGAEKVLRAAALTYVASALTALSQLMRLLLIFSGSGRRRND